MTHSLKPLELTETLESAYRRYLETKLAPKGPLGAAFRRALREDELLKKGPLLEASLPFTPGRSLGALVAAGDLASGCDRLKGFSSQRPLHWHQEEAILRARRHNLIVATGTGSGKTECFLLPIIDHLLRERAEKTLTPGVRAMLLYPMNALANDQIKRLRDLLADLPEITFGRYTGDTPQGYDKALAQYKEQNDGQEPPTNELICRDQMQATPPHILLTNYAMLEYLLLRPDDSVFFDGEGARHWRHWVLDEVHSYNGTKAADIAMLLRRLKDRIFQSEPGRLRCIGTSATLGAGEEDRAEVLAFAEALFAEPFGPESLILARRDAGWGRGERPWGRGSAALYARLREGLGASAVPEALAAIAREEGVPAAACEAALQFASVGLPDAPLPALEAPGGERRRGWGRASADQAADEHHSSSPAGLAAARFLFALLRDDEHFGALLDTLEAGPQRFKHLAGRFFGADPQAQAALAALVDLAVAAREDAQAQPLLPARYHLFLSALEGAFFSPDPESGEFTLSLQRCESLLVAGERRRAFELSSCGRCAHPFLTGRLVPAGRHVRLEQSPLAFSLDPEDESETVYFRWDAREEGERDGDAEAWETPETEVALRHDPYQLCLCCGGVTLEAGAPSSVCDCESPRLWRIYRVKVPQGAAAGLRRCPVCHYQPPGRSAIEPMSVGQDAPVAVLATALYQQLPASKHRSERQLPGEGRKLIVFSDSRQDAAYFAPYFHQSYQHFLQRRALMQALREEGGCASIEALIRRLGREEYGLLFPAEMKHDAGVRRHAAANWVLRELRESASRRSLAGTGLLAWQVAPGVWRRALESNGMSARDVLAELSSHIEWREEDLPALFEALLSSVRDSALSFPAETSPSEEAFEPRRFHISMAERHGDAAAHVLSWISQGSARNRRGDYLERLLAKLEPASEAASRAARIRTFLGDFWRFCVEIGVFRPTQASGEASVSGARQLDHARLEAIALWDGETSCRPLYRCDVCERLTAHQVGGVCASFRCEGEVQRFENKLELPAHYRHLYEELALIPLKAEEHTAQLESREAARVQNDFIQARTNVLSCSTTFEMGVDVGDLQMVLMRNVPPETANYLQRAGRAGRRSDSLAFIVTFAQRRNHDLYHFAEPERMVGGRMRAPFVPLRNKDLLRRHLYAMAIAQLFRQHPGLLPELRNFFGALEDGLDGPGLLKRHLRQCPAELLAAVRRVAPEDMHVALGVETWQWAGDLLNEADSARSLESLASLYQEDLEEYRRFEQEFKAKENYGGAKAMQNVVRTLTERKLLPYLANKGVLPKYGFPAYSVDLAIETAQADAERLEFSRDLRLALSEYAPGALLVGAGRLWQAGGIKVRKQKGWESFFYRACRCGYYEEAREASALPPACPACERELKGPARKYILPEFGFVMSPEAPQKAGGQRPRRISTTRLFFCGGEDAQEISYRPFGTPAGGAAIEVKTPSQGRLAVLNLGPGQRGYAICDACGAAESYATLRKGALKRGAKAGSEHKTPRGKPCFSRYSLEPRQLGHRFDTDLIELQFSGASDASLGFAYSLLYALLQGAKQVLELKEDDLDGCLSASRDGQRLILFDNVPGGAGLVERLYAQFEQVLEAALAHVEGCACAHDSACYQCLRSYRNQPFHAALRRGPVADFLAEVLGGMRRKDLVRQRLRGARLDATLRKELEGAASLCIAAPGVLFAEHEQQATGAIDWELLFGQLLKAGVPVKVLLDGISTEGAEGRYDEALWRLFQNEKGLALRLGPTGTLPWGIVLKRRDGTLRAFDVRTSAGAPRLALASSAGRSGLFASHDASECRGAIDVFDAAFAQGRPYQSAHRLGTQVRRLVGGERLPHPGAFVWSFCAVEAPILAVSLNDPYLRKPHQIDNLRDFVNALLGSPHAQGCRLTVRTARDGDREARQAGYDSRPEQTRLLSALQEEVARRGSSLEIRYDASHDREVQLQFSDGRRRTVFLGRGLDLRDRDGIACPSVLIRHEEEADGPDANP